MTTEYGRPVHGWHAARQGDTAIPCNWCGAPPEQPCLHYPGTDHAAGRPPPYHQEQTGNRPPAAQIEENHGTANRA